jgi:YgiT-type zinc finger domain-containing protein
MWPCRALIFEPEIKSPPPLFPRMRRRETTMKCQTPECIGEHEAGTLTSHSVLYRERTFVIHQVPAHVCPECGDVTLLEETTHQITFLLGKKHKSKKDSFHYEA